MLLKNRFTQPIVMIATKSWFNEVDKMMNLRKCLSSYFIAQTVRVSLKLNCIFLRKFLNPNFILNDLVLHY
jgi:hypothetical protein